MENLPSHRLIRSGVRGWLKLFAVWSIPVAVGASAYWMQSSYGESQQPFSWFLVQNWIWYLWAALCPWAYFLVVRYPSGKRLWLRGIPLHLLTGIFSSVLFSAVYGVFRAIQYGGQTWWQGALTNITRPGSFGGYIQTTVIYGLVAGAMFAVYSSRLRAQRDEEAASLELRTAQLEGQLAQAQLHALQTQLQPHFLFNALNSLASLVEQQRHHEAFHMIGLLGELLRASLDRSRGSTLSLRDEVDLLERYLEIERVRFPQRLRCEIHIEEDCLQAAVPTLILQPLVENSIRHAIQRDASAGRIRIQASRRGDQLQLRVEDDGPGLPAGWNLQDNAGIGLSNVAQRLEAHYGSRQRLSVENVEPQGVAVNIDLPFTASGVGPSDPGQTATALPPGGEPSRSWRGDPAAGGHAR